MTIVITRHAAEQALSRASLDEDGVLEAVEQALEEGRCSVDRPAFLGPGSGARDGLYCWDAGESVAFLVCDDNRKQVVVTVLSSDRGPTAVEQAFARARARAAAVTV